MNAKSVKTDQTIHHGIMGRCEQLFSFISSFFTIIIIIILWFSNEPGFGGRGALIQVELWVGFLSSVLMTGLSINVLTNSIFDVLKVHQYSDTVNWKHLTRIVSGKSLS